MGGNAAKFSQNCAGHGRKQRLFILGEKGEYVALEAPLQFFVFADEPLCPGQS